MNIIVCLDDNNGMLFNRRRQSMDRELRKRVLELTKDSTLWMNPYTAKQFTEPATHIVVDDAFLLRAGEEDYCFVEDADISSCMDKVRRVILYRWNRSYPADMFFPSCSMKQIRVTEFPGSSHEKITEEVYIL